MIVNCMLIYSLQYQPPKLKSRPTARVDQGDDMRSPGFGSSPGARNTGPPGGRGGPSGGGRTGPAGTKGSTRPGVGKYIHILLFISENLKVKHNSLLHICSFQHEMHGSACN